MNKTNQKLELLTDNVVDENNDAFNHEIYADLLAEIFHPKVNEAGISVGLFGKWGQGKSCIVEMLQKKLNTQHGKQIEIVWFNAWQTRGDSFRRQLLLAILQKINPATEKKLRKEAGLSALPEMTATQQSKFFDRLKCAWVILKQLWWVPILFVLIFLGLISLVRLSISNPKFQETFMGLVGVGTSIFASIFILAKNQVNRTASVYLGSDQSIKSHAIRYPEQFLDYFRICASRFCKGGKREILVVVDDIDRCDPETVTEALAAIRQLGACKKRTHRKKSHPIICRFLVPCDEKQVVLALEADGHDAGDEGGRYHDYQSEELLRKFFDVTVRMDKLLPRDLTRYAEQLATEIGVENLQAIRILMHAVAPEDPRQAKKLVNAYKTACRKVALCRDRGILPNRKDGLPCLTNTLIAIVALREIFPTIYSDFIAETPENIRYLKTGDMEKFKELRIFTNLTEKKQKRTLSLLRKASETLHRLSKINLSTAELLIHGQAEEGLRGVPLQGQIYRAVRSNNSEIFINVLPEKKQQREKVFGWLFEKIEFGLSTPEIQHTLNLVLDYAIHIDKNSTYTKESLIHLLLNSQFSFSVLEDFERIAEFSEAVITLEDKQKELFFKKVKIKDPMKPETSLYFSIGDRLPEKIKNYFSLKLLKLAKIIDEPDDAFSNNLLLKQGYDLLPKERIHCYGIAPAAGKAMLCSGWFGNNESVGDYTNQTEFSLLLLGDDKEVVIETLNSLLKKGVWFKDEDFDQTVFRNIRIFWRCVCDLLIRNNGDDAVLFFDVIYELIIYDRTDDECRWLCKQLKPALYWFSQEQLGTLGAYLGERLSTGEASWAFEFIGEKNSNTEKWTSITSSCAQALLDTQEGNIPYAEQTNVFFNEMLSKKWDVVVLIDELLAEKLNSISDGTEIVRWVNGCLRFLNGKRSPASREKIKYCIENQQWVNVSIQIGLKTCWRSTISKVDAELIASGMLSQKPDHRRLNWLCYGRLPRKRGAVVVFDNLITKINGYDYAWQAENMNLLIYIAKHINSASPEKKVLFSSIMESMIASEDEDTIIAALGISIRLPLLDRSLKKSMRDLYKSNPSDEVKTKIKKLLPTV